MLKDDFIRGLKNISQTEEFVECFEKKSDVEYIFRVYSDENKKFSRPVSVSLSDSWLVIAFSIIGKAPTDSPLLWNLLEENKDGHFSKLFIMGEDLARGVLYPLEIITSQVLGGIIIEIAQKSYYCLNKYF